LARNLQALRKEKGFNPTEILKTARVSGLLSQTLALIEKKKEELAFLVRVEKVELNTDMNASQSWSEAEIDGTQIKIDIV
ncbi:MAG: hypothetical protein JRN67_05810, partial [Nitrososphaerota archaeon]|nr:hypothetical protein [Nitrososphaerota archaeon]